MRLFSTFLGPKASVDIEAAIAGHMERSKISRDYEAKVRQLAFNLRKTPGLRDVPPSTLVQLTDKALATGTDVERWTAEFEVDLANEVRLVNSNIECASLLKCRRCKSDRISTKQVQTRGADEAMTVFCECDACSLRWKM